jgi:hypothetical protein
MTRDKIITDLFVSKDFTGCIAKMKPECLQDELKSEVALILCEMSEEKILELYNSGGLKFYTVRIILNLIKSNTSPFYKKFRGNNIELSELIEPFIEQPEPCLNDKKDSAILGIENLYWYDREIIKLYGKLGTYRAVEAETGIPFESIYKTVQRACKAIRKKVA